MSQGVTMIWCQDMEVLVKALAAMKAEQGSCPSKYMWRQCLQMLIVHAGTPPLHETVPRWAGALSIQGIMHVMGCCHCGLRYVDFFPNATKRNCSSAWTHSYNKPDFASSLTACTQTSWKTTFEKLDFMKYDIWHVLTWAKSLMVKPMTLSFPHVCCV